MTQEHPIAPPPELIEQWVKRYEDGAGLQPLFYSIFQAGADRELEALLVWLRVKGFDNLASDLLSARRPKPPSLKEQALEALDRMDQFPTADDQHIIRRALEQLND